MEKFFFGAQMNAAIGRKLRALEHPQPDSVTLDEDDQLRSLVKWLENRKIRYYAPEDRAALDATESPAWPAALQAYIKDLGGEATKPDSKRAREVIIDWLLSYAIGMEYSDRADTLQKIVAVPARPPLAAVRPAQNAVAKASPSVRPLSGDCSLLHACAGAGASRLTLH